jgi:DNA-binding response OmpR family regulator
MTTLLIVSADAAFGQFYANHFKAQNVMVKQCSRWTDVITVLETQEAPTVVLLEAKLPDGSAMPIVSHLRSHTKFEHTHLVVLLEERASFFTRPRREIEHLLNKPLESSYLVDYLSPLLVGTEAN